jgi:two-component system, NarL family, sensor kinase
MNLSQFAPTTQHRDQGFVDRALIALALLLATTGALLVLATFVLWVLNRTAVDLGDELGSLGDLLTAFAACVVAGLILVRRPHHRIGWLLLTIGLLWATEWFGEAYGRYAYQVRQQMLPGAAFFTWLAPLTWIPGFGLVIWLILLFPTGRPLAPAWAWVGRIATLLTLPISLLMGVASWPLSGPQLFAITFEEHPPPLDQAQQQVMALFESPLFLGLPLAFLLLLPATGSIFLRLRRAHGVERQQLKWFAYGVSLLAGTMTLLTLIRLLTESQESSPPMLAALWEILYIIAPTMLPVAIGIAILRHRLWDIDLIIRRTLIYGLLTTVVVAVYVLIVGSLGTLLTGLSGGEPAGQSTLWQTLPLQLAAAGVVAVIFQPLRHWLQQRVNRLLYGEVDAPYAVVARLGQQLETTLAPEKVLTTIVQTVREALRLPYVALQVKNSTLRAQSTLNQPEDLITGDQPVPAGTVRTWPLIHQGEHVGDLLVTVRIGEDDFSTADRHLLDGLASQAGAAIQAVRLNADLQQSRHRLVTTREEERRRLRRDLHDALGATLAAIAMQADAARSLVDEAPDESKTLLADLTQQAQEAIADVRRLIYNLRPPALDDLGLVAALRQLAHAHSQSSIRIEVVAPEHLPTLSAAVEVAAYRIVQEALTNVIKHAQARRCVVSIAIGPKGEESLPDVYSQGSHAATLQVQIRDDGIGLPAQRKAGVGMSSMRERAEELGGTVAVEALPCGGTSVRAHLPLA